MFLIRHVEETLLSLYSHGEIAGTIHTSVGQESCAVGVIAALDRSRDVVWSNHRNHGHFIEFTDDPEGLIAEILGRATGVCRGIGGSQHLHGPRIYTNGVLGGTVACAVGSALAEKRADSGAISVAFFGDGALGEGIIYESFNLAALWELPILFVLEHNQYAQSTPTSMEHAGELSDRAAPFGIPSFEVEAISPSAVYEATTKAVEHVRSAGPFFLTVRTYRLGPHSKGDDTRDPGELAARREVDPLNVLRAELATVDGQLLESIEASVTSRIDQAVRGAMAAPHLELSEFLKSGAT